VNVAVAAGAAVALGVLTIVALERRLPSELDEGLGSGHKLVAAWAIMCALAVGQTARLSVFMADDAHTEQSALPVSPFITNHSCYTAYYEAGRLLPEVPNVYEPTLYRAGREWRRIGRFGVDHYEYPPPFLLLPRVLSFLGRDFFAQRAVWFLVQFAVAAAAVVAFGLRMVRSTAGGRFVLFAPVLLLMLPVRLTLQTGNYQIVAIALCLLAFAAFDAERDALGGALLGFAIDTKLFPALLVVLLLAQRRYRAAAWSVAMSGAIAGASYLVLGAPSYESFVSFQLPRLANGDAFPMLKAFLPAVMINHSVYGVVVKGIHLGVAGLDFRVASIVAWLYTVVAVALVVVVGRRGSPRDPVPVLFCLALAALRSPFLPQEYAEFVPMLLLLVMAARAGHTPTRGALLGVAAVALGVVVPLDWIRPHDPAPMVAALVPQIAGIAVLVAAYLTVPRKAGPARAG
jgi:hypothetical protein